MEKSIKNSFLQVNPFPLLGNKMVTPGEYETLSTFAELNQPPCPNFWNGGREKFSDIWQKWVFPHIIFGILDACFTGWMMYSVIDNQQTVTIENLLKNIDSAINYFELKRYKLLPKEIRDKLERPKNEFKIAEKVYLNSDEYEGEVCPGHEDQPVRLTATFNDYSRIYSLNEDLNDFTQQIIRMLKVIEGSPIPEIKLLICDTAIEFFTAKKILTEEKGGQ